jgi:RNA methyltransferase, TrmH family
MKSRPNPKSRFSKEDRGSRRPSGFSAGPTPRKEGEKPFARREKRSDGGFPNRSDNRFSGPREDRSSGFRKPRRFDREAGPQPEGRFRPHLGDDEMRYLGKNSCISVWKKRPKDLIRVYIAKDLSDEYSELLEFCAKHKKSYHLVNYHELEKLTDSKHHEGICVVAKEKRPLREVELFRELDGNRNLILYLDGVGNPHNLGAILRTAAHFGVSFICGEKEEMPRISPAAHRTSEGGAESTNLVLVEDTERFFDRLKGMGFQVYAFDPKSDASSLFETRISERSVFVMGAEVSGVSGLLHAIADAKLKIPGTGAVESLNVSVAAALAMAEFQRQSKQGTVRIVKKT